MRAYAVLLLLGAVAAARAEDPEPAVQTSPAAAARVAGESVKPLPKAAPSPAAGRSRAMDQIDLGATQVTGNRELPNVMYVVPWKRPDLGEFAGRPPKSLLDELLAPVDRDVFRRQNRYFAALHPDTAARPVVPAPTPAAGAAPAPTAGDEK